MGKYLIFHLYGPMASFGDTAVGEYRPTFSHPSKSAIIGLIAAALGIRRTDEAQLRVLSSQLGFGVLVLSQGRLLRDYHTTQVPSQVTIKKGPAYTRRDELSYKDQNTILSTRDYRTDAAYRIALWVLNDSMDLARIQKAILAPVFTPYLGRKSCPSAIPFQPELVDASSAVEALSKTRHKLGDMLKDVVKDGLHSSGEDKKYLLYLEYEQGMDSNNLEKHWRKDRLISRRNWQYGDRQEILVEVGGDYVLE